MFKIVFTRDSYSKIDEYVFNYRKYFENLYQDTGIWEENKIIDNYIIESEERYFQIFDTIVEKLSQSLPSYSENQVIIRWRTKILLVSFKESGDTRTIIDIDIR